MEQTLTPEKDFRPTLKACCRLHWQLNVSDRDLHTPFSEAAGDYAGIEQSVSSTWAEGRWTGTSFSRKDAVFSRISANEVKRVSANPRLSFFTSSMDFGFYQWGAFPQIVETDYHITREEYERRKHLPPPAYQEGMIRRYQK